MRWESLLEDREEAVRLAAHSHGQGEVLNSVGDVAIGQQLLAKLNLLQEEPLYSLLVGEVRQLGARSVIGSFGCRFPLLPELPLKVRVTASLPRLRFE